MGHTYRGFDYKSLFSGLVFMNKNKLRSLESSEHINEKMDGPYRGFDYKSLFSDPLDLA